MTDLKELAARRIAEIATARGVAPPTAKRSPRVAATVRTAKPANTVDPVLTRRLPMSWQRCSDDRWRGGKYSRSQAECRVACWLVAKALGTDWRKEITEHDVCHLVHASGLRLRFEAEWQDMDRYDIAPLDAKIRRDDPLPERITVSAGRTPLSIAADIENRLLAHGAIEGHRAVVRDAKARRRRSVIERRTMLLIARRLGGYRLARQDRWKYSSCPEIEPVQLPGCGVGAVMDYSDKITFTITCRDRKTASRVAQAIQWEYR